MAPPKPDMDRGGRHGRKVPRPAVSRCNNVKPTLLNDFVGAGKQGRRDFEAERLGSLEIDDEFDFS